MGRFAELGAELDARQDAELIDRVVLREPRQAAAATWRYAGTLDVWIQDRGEWYGRVRDDSGHVFWVPAADLRPVTDGPRET